MAKPVLHMSKSLSRVTTAADDGLATGSGTAGTGCTSSSASPSPNLSTSTRRGRAGKCSPS